MRSLKAFPALQVDVMLAAVVEIGAAFLGPHVWTAAFEGFQDADNVTDLQSQIISQLADILLLNIAAAARLHQANACQHASACARAGLPLTLASRDTSIWQVALIQILELAEEESGLVAMQPHTHAFQLW